MLDYTFYRHYLVNKTVQWYQSDSEENYKSENKYGPNLYKPGSFDYTFNSNGFRCDEFNLTSQIPILFLGCSFTEGEGLPIDKCWAYLILEHIRKATNKTIPYWNLAMSAASIDMNAAVLASFIDQLKPKYIFYLRPPWMRRTVFVEQFHIQNWLPNWPVGFNRRQGWQIPEYFNKTLVHEPFAIQQADRSLTIIDLLAERYKTKVFHFSWQLDVSENTIQPSIERLKNFHQMKGPWLSSVDMARDSHHPGPATHRIVANRLWEFYLKHLF
jgi:hypothetical protein